MYQIPYFIMKQKLKSLSWRWSMLQYHTSFGIHWTLLWDKLNQWPSFLSSYVMPWITLKIKDFTTILSWYMTRWQNAITRFCHQSNLSTFLSMTSLILPCSKNQIPTSLRIQPCSTSNHLSVRSKMHLKTRFLWSKYRLKRYISGSSFLTKMLRKMIW